MGKSDRRVLRWAGALLVAAAVTASPRRAAAAEDGPIPRLETVEDSKGRVSIGVPPGSVREEPQTTETYVFEVWLGDVDGRPEEYDVYIHLGERPAFSRAVLAGSTTWGAGMGTLMPGTSKSGAGEWTEERRVEGNDVLVISRVIEGKGTVYVAEVQIRESRAEEFRPAAKQILATFRALKEWTAPALPGGFVRWEVSGCEVWSDAKKADVDRLTREFADCAAMFRKLEAGAPAAAEPPRLVICSKSEDYVALWRAPGPGAPPGCFHDALGRAVVVDLAVSRPDGFVGTFRRAVCSRLVTRWMGGLPPAWVLQGLSGHLVSGMTNEGKFAQGTASLVSKAKGAALKANRPLTALLDVMHEPADGLDEFGDEAYAWHFFFRFGKGQKPWGETYRKYLEVLRRTGDAGEARKAFDGTDHAKMHREFLDWVNRWKEGKPLG